MIGGVQIPVWAPHVCKQVRDVLTVLKGSLSLAGMRSIRDTFAKWTSHEFNKCRNASAGSLEL